MLKARFECCNTLCGLLVLICSCYGCMPGSYAGNYWLNKSSNYSDSKQFYETIERIVRNVASCFGFTEDKLPYGMEDLVSFGKNPKIKTKYDALKGADAEISLVLGKEGSATIYIRDYTNGTETEFIRALKVELETQLHSEINMSDVIFDKQIISFQ